jgi:3-oxoacyl-[acyl-carrier-protein] synthase III
MLQDLKKHAQVSRFKNVSILSVAHVDAPLRISSISIEEQLATTMKRIGIRADLFREISGVVERRFWKKGFQPSDGAAEAGRLAIERAGIDKSQLGILINSSVSRDFIEPSTACIVHSKLGLAPACLNFDLGNACLAFINSMDVVGNMIERGQIDYGIVVNGESARFVVENTIKRLQDPATDGDAFRENFATLTIGSGAAAMVLTRSDLAPNGHRYLGGVNIAATEHRNLCRGQVDHMVTDTKDLLKNGLDLAAKTWRTACQKLGWTANPPDHYVFHQVSKVHTEKLAGILGLDLAKVFRLYPNFGNVGPAGVPIVLSKILEDGRLVEGHRVALMGIGSGLNCTMAEVVW